MINLFLGSLLNGLLMYGAAKYVEIKNPRFIISPAWYFISGFCLGWIIPLIYLAYSIHEHREYNKSVKGC